MARDRDATAMEMMTHGAVMNLRVIVALVFREAAMRFGAGPFAYAWTLVEPAVLIGFVLAIRVYISQSNPAFGDSSTIFLLTGFMIFRIARQTIQKSGRALGANQALYNFGMIKILDTVVARTIVEFLIWLIVLTVFFSAVSYILQEVIITKFQGFCLTLLLIYYFCLSMSLFNAIVGALLPLWNSLWKIMSMPLMIMSGVFYVPATMPPEIIAVIEWNPFLHCIEGIRSNSYLDFITIYDPVYLATFSTIALLISLTLEALFRNEIVKAKQDDDEEDELL